MNKLIRLAGVAGCALAILAMSGGYWLALQSVAWMRMTLEFSQQDGWRAAIAKTFDGRHPCSLCLKVRQGWHQQKEQEKKLPWLQAENLPEAVWEWRSLTAPPPPTFSADDAVFAAAFWFDFSNSPPTPPPRA